MQALSKEKIKQSFSKAAPTYDEAAGFQKEVGRILIERIPEDFLSGGFILDVGMGTGSLTQGLSRRLRNCKAYGIDMAWGMVSLSKKNTDGVFVSQADFENLPYKNGIFDIVFSNISYQWAGDLRKAFFEIKRVLKMGGRFYFSILVKGSLKELYEILRRFGRDPGYINFLPDTRLIRSKLAQAGFIIDWHEEMAIKRYYDSALGLMRALKKIGAAKISESNIFNMGERRLFFKMVAEYDRSFFENGRTFATYNVILGCGCRI